MINQNLKPPMIRDNTDEKSNKGKHKYNRKKYKRNKRYKNEKNLWRKTNYIKKNG